MSLHSTLTGSTNIHTVIAYTYANYDDMTGASGFASTDIGKIAIETDNGSYWILVNTDPTWTALGTSNYISATIDSNVTLGVVPSVYWVQDTDADPYQVNLPPPASMTNRVLIFVTYGYSEYTFTILPNASETIQGGSSYAVNGPGASVTMICDGTNWYVTASASNY